MIKTTISLISTLFIALALHVSAAPKPNVVMILTDDLGWQDVGCYDVDKPSPYETPQIDRLATLGFKFTQAYSPAPTCAPTRCAILSGKHPARAQKTHVVGGGPPSPHGKGSLGIDPWYSGRMRTEEVTIAEILGENGYRSGAVGKWHCAINHHAFPQPKDQGFDYATMRLGVTKRMKPDRLTEFATTEEGDPFKLDENDFPYHQNTEDALTFLKEQSVKDADPFFLYFATFLVHTPIHTRSEKLLKKYCEKMGVEMPTDPSAWTIEGQKNPYYGAMVEARDYHVGRIVTYLETTDDPRNPGHKLIDNTYLIFTSDNGGMEKDKTDDITDNYPLDHGKISAKEGGVRVPLIILGPGIEKGVVSDEMVNGLDFYPTILNWTKTPQKEGQILDGIELATYLTDTSKTLERDTLYWHFPHSRFQSTIRNGGDKLIYYPLKDYQGQASLELYRLYDADGKRQDIEEAKNLAKEEPKRTQELYAMLQEKLKAVNASMPSLNPHLQKKLKNSDKIPSDFKLETKKTDDGRYEVTAQFKENGAKVTRGSVYYTDNGGDTYEEWYPVPDTKLGEGAVTAVLPKDTTHYVFNFLDENHFLESYPRLKSSTDYVGKPRNYSEDAIAVPE